MFWYPKVNKSEKKNKKLQYEESAHLMGIYGYPGYQNVIPPPKSSRPYEGITVLDTLISIN